MRRQLPLVVVLILVAGCGRPFHLITRDALTIENPIVAHARVSLDSAPVGKDSPVVPMSLSGEVLSAQGPRVALLDVDGLLLNTDFTGPFSTGENPVAIFREKLDAIAADPCVCALVLRINSPGGSVTASDIMLHELQRYRERTHRPVIACLLDVGAGGAYYLATGADAIVAHPTTITGGMGVILNLYNLRDAMAMVNVTTQEVKAGEHIDLGTPTKLLDEEGRKLLQAIADEMHARFQQQVKQSRPRLDDSKGPLFDGRIFTAGQARERGLIDRVGYLEEAIEMARERGGCAQAAVALYHRANDPARSPYAVTPNTPLQATALPLSLPGYERSKLPTFLYLWQPEVTMERLGGK